MGNSSSTSSHHKRDGQLNYYTSSTAGSSSRGRNHGPPSAPGKPYLVVAAPADEPDVITVKWKPPAHDGGTKITGYIVEHRRTISPHWVKATPGKVQQNHLTLSGLEPGWRYQFRVKAVNSSGHSPASIVSDPVTMTVHRTAVVAPVFVSGIEDRVALENEQVKFEVEFEGTPTPKISWYKDGFELFSNRRQRVNTDNGVSTLYIHQAEYSDEGEIKCSATNRAGHAITKARLRLEAPPMVRLPQDYEEGLLLEQNEPMRLKVSVSGRPLPQVTWLHDGEEIRGGDRFEVIHTDKYAALKLPCVKRSDRGCYQIQAVNPLGDHTASFLVTVTDRPSPPGKVHVSKRSGKSVTLSWKPPEDDGGCKIGNYIIEYNRVGWDMWLKASTSRQLTADLDDLLEGSEYTFRVKAENPYGVSKPSEVSEPIFLPDIKRGIYKPTNTTPSLLFEDEEKLVKIQETEMLENFGRKSKSPEPTSAKSRKLSVDEVSPPVPKRRKKKKKSITDSNGSETDIYHSMSFLDVSAETWHQPIEQKDHWGLPRELKANSGSRKSSEDLPSSQTTPLDYKAIGNSTESLSLFNFERGPAPPISLSSPELGAESEGFEEQIRNSYSSSELLYERNLNRFNGYSNDEHASAEAQKIAIYAMDRKNSLRRSPITRSSTDGSVEGKTIFSDSDSVHSVVDLSGRTNASSFMSLATSIEEEEVEAVGQQPEAASKVTDLSPKGSDDEPEEESSSSDGGGGGFTMNFGSGRRALEPNASGAFFSTVFYDDDYLSDHRLSDRERSASPAAMIKPNRERSVSPAVVNETVKDPSPDAISQDSLNSSAGASSEVSERSQSLSEKDDEDGENPSEEVRVIESPAVEEDRPPFRPRDGIPKYAMLPNPFYRENPGDRVKFELSSNSADGIVPPEIPERGVEGAAVGGRLALPVITVTETIGNDRSPKSVLKKIFVPALSGIPDDEPSKSQSYYEKYNNVNSAAFGTLRSRSPEPAQPVAEDVPPEMVVVRHYGDIVQRYSGAAKKTTGSMYLDFEQLKQAAAVDGVPDADAEVDEGIDYDEEEGLPQDDGLQEYYGEWATGRGPGEDDGLSELRFRPPPAVLQDESYNDSTLALVSQQDDVIVGQLQQVETAAPNTVPYLKIFGNLSLALFGYWLYAYKDEKLSVPVFGFLLFRFFKTQIWDRI